MGLCGLWIYCRGIQGLADIIGFRVQGFASVGLRGFRVDISSGWEGLASFHMCGFLVWSEIYIA